MSDAVCGGFFTFIFSDYFCIMAIGRLSLLSPSSPNLNFLKAFASVDNVLFGFADNELKVLLIKSDLEIYKNQWSLLGDLVRPFEDLESAYYKIKN